MIDQRALLASSLGASAALLLPRAGWAQTQPGPPTPGVVQATIADPAPSQDVSGRISATARGKALMVVNKAALTIGFYDAGTGMQQALFARPSRPHELLVARDGRYTYVSIYGDGIYGQNPHPGNQIAMIDLARRAPVGFLSTGAVLAPHGLAEAPDGTIWATCDIGAAVVGFDPRSQKVIAVIEIGGRGGHWIVADRTGKAYLSNRAGPGIPVLDLIEPPPPRHDRDAARNHRARSVARRTPAVRGRRSGACATRHQHRLSGGAFEHDARRPAASDGEGRRS